jgi:hypothetical protein
MDARFGDIEQFPAVYKLRYPTAKSVPWPPQYSRPRKFQPGSLQWIDVWHRDMRCGHWELGTNNPCRHERTSTRLTQVHLGSHPGQIQGYGYPFHEILGPEFEVVHSSVGINQQRPLQFQRHAWFKVGVER